MKLQKIPASELKVAGTKDVVTSVGTKERLAGYWIFRLKSGYLFLKK